MRRQTSVRQAALLPPTVVDKPPVFPVSPKPETTFWLERKDQVTVTVIALGLMACLSFQWFAYELTDQPPIVERPASYRINVNTANVVEISQLKGIGPVLAKRIVDSRIADGPFANIDDLKRVKGIGTSKVEANRDSITAK